MRLKAVNEHQLNLTPNRGTVSLRPVLNTAALQGYVDQGEALLAAQEAIAGADTADDLITALDANPASDFRVQQDARLTATYVAQAKRPVSLRDAPGIDWTGATDSAAAVQAALDAAGVGALIDVDLRDGIIRCDSTLTMSLFQRLRGSVQKAGAGPTGATFDFSNMGATDTAIDASAGSVVFEDIHIVGPGSNNTSSKGFYTSGAGSSAITMSRCTAQRFGYGAHLTAQYYANFDDTCEFIYNRVGVYLSSCYNVTMDEPKFFCGGTDSYQGTGIITNTVRALNIFAGSIEGYGTIIGTPNDAGIVVGSGSIVNVKGTYFEAPASANAVAIDVTSATNYILNVSGCEAYLMEHRAFIDAEGSTSAGTINSGGNQFNCASSTTPTDPKVYLLGTNTGLVVNVGVGELDSMHGVSLASVVYIDNQGTATDRQTVRVPRELLSGSGQGGFYLGDPLRTVPSTTTRSGLRIPAGAAPSSPANGDVWNDGTQLAARVNGVTRPITATPWVTPTLLNSWAQYASGVAEPVGYRKVGDRVELRGWIVGGADGSTAFTLPAGFRPVGLHVQACVANYTNTAVVRVNHSTGDVAIIVRGAADWTSLDGIWFSTVA